MTKHKVVIKAEKGKYLESLTCYDEHGKPMFKKPEHTMICHSVEIEAEEF